MQAIYFTLSLGLFLLGMPEKCFSMDPFELIRKCFKDLPMNQEAMDFEQEFIQTDYYKGCRDKNMENPFCEDVCRLNKIGGLGCSTWNLQPEEDSDRTDIDCTVQAAGPIYWFTPMTGYLYNDETPAPKHMVEKYTNQTEATSGEIVTTVYDNVDKRISECVKKKSFPLPRDQTELDCYNLTDEMRNDLEDMVQCFEKSWEQC